MSKSPFLVSNFNIKSVKEDDSDFYIVKGYASVYGNVDSYRDIVMPGAFAKDLLENGNERPILWQHQSSKPIGIGIFEEKQEGLFVEIKMPKDSKFVKEEVMPMIKCGAVKGMSIGYWVKDESWDQEERVNRLKELKLRENSIVTFPANELAQITAAKQFLGLETKSEINLKNYPLADEKTGWDENEAIQDIKSNTGSDEKPSKHYGKGFLITDPEKKDDFSGYKIPYVKYMDGEFKIIPQAIFKASGEIASGKLNLSADAERQLKDHVNMIYKKLGKEEPFKGEKFFIDKVTLKHIKKCDLDIIFNNQVMLSTGAKSEIIEKLRSPGLDGSVSGDNNDLELLDSLKELRKSMKIN